MVSLISGHIDSLPSSYCLLLPAQHHHHHHLRREAWHAYERANRITGRRLLPTATAAAIFSFHPLLCSVYVMLTSWMHIIWLWLVSFFAHTFSHQSNLSPTFLFVSFARRSITLNRVVIKCISIFDLRLCLFFYVYFFNVNF